MAVGDLGLEYGFVLRTDHCRLFFFLLWCSCLIIICCFWACVSIRCWSRPVSSICRIGICLYCCCEPCVRFLAEREWTPLDGLCPDSLCCF